MEPLRRLLLQVLLLGGLSSGDAGAGEQGWPEVFDPFRVLTLHLEMESGDWSTVRNDTTLSEEVPARFWAEGETNRYSVRVRRKSGPALTNGGVTKVALKVDINDLVPGQAWRGLKKLSLESGAELSVLREGFGWQLFRLASERGVFDYPSAYAAWVRVVVNGEYQGVYANTEQRDKQFLENRGMHKEGASWLYKVDGGVTREVGTNDSPTLAHLCYAPFTSGPGGPGGVGECQTPELEEELAAWVDVRGMLALAAIEAFSGNGDALFTHDNKNSYAADFFPPTQLRRLYFPWDLDTGFAQVDFDIYRGPRGVTEYQELVLGHYWFGEVYRHVMIELLDGALSLEVMNAFLDRLEPVLGPALDEDPNAERDFADLRDWLVRRVANVRMQVGELLEPPRFSLPGGEVLPGFVLSMEHSNVSGIIYYTLDGRDPRAVGGLPAGPAYTDPLVMETTTCLTARVLSGTNWSDLRRAVFNVAGHGAAMRFTEIMYRPEEGGKYEFLELQNTGAEPVNLSGAYLRGVEYRFPPGTVVAGGEHYLLVKNPVSFAERYPGVSFQGVYWGGLDMAGERITLRNSDGNVLCEVRYGNDLPWVQGPNGLGYSLVWCGQGLGPDDPRSWRSSTERGGSPGGADPEPSHGLGVWISELLTHSDPPYEDAVELVNLGRSPVDIGGWYLSDSLNRTNREGSLRKFAIPPGTILSPGGWVVFYELDFNPTPGIAPSFALSQYGESVYLAAVDAGGNLTGEITGWRFGAAENGVPWGMHPTTEGWDLTLLEAPTFDLSAPASLSEFRNGAGAGNAAARVGPVVISEVMYRPDGNGAEYVELHNLTDGSLDLEGWELEGVDLVFGPGTVMGAGGYLVVADTNRVSLEQFRLHHAMTGTEQVRGHGFTLANEGESLRLLRPNTDPDGPRIRVDRVRYQDGMPWPTEADGLGYSMERVPVGAYGNEPLHWRTLASQGTPGWRPEEEVGVALALGSRWRHHPGSRDLGEAWRQEGYRDEGWLSSRAPLAFTGAAPVYLRKKVVLPDDPRDLARLALSIRCLGEFVLYVNGLELRVGSGMGDRYEEVDLIPWRDVFRKGANQVAVVLAASEGGLAESSWDAGLVYEAMSPDAIRIVEVAWVAGGGLRLRWSAVVGREYGIEASTDLTGWDDLGVKVEATGTWADFLDTTAHGGAVRFYRVREN